MVFSRRIVLSYIVRMDGYGVLVDAISNIYNRRLAVFLSLNESGRSRHECESSFARGTKYAF